MSKINNFKTVNFEALSELGIAWLQDAVHASITRHDSDERSTVFIPKKFNKQQAEDYVSALETISKHREEVVRKLQAFLKTDAAPEETEPSAVLKDTERLLTPLAQYAKITLTLSNEQLRHLCLTLSSSQLAELQNIADQLKTILPEPLPRSQKEYTARVRQDMEDVFEELTEPLSIQLQRATLLGTSMRNELALVPYILYPHTSLSFEELIAEVDEWKYDRKLAVLEGYLGARTQRDQIPGSALKNIDYHWEVLADFVTTRQLADIASQAHLAHQPLSPRFGYDVPELIEEAGAADEFEECFDVSYQLFSNIQKAGFYVEAQYAALHGHKQRLSLRYDAQMAFTIHERAGALSAPPRLRSLMNVMHERLYEVHPLLASSMKFVNR